MRTKKTENSSFSGFALQCFIKNSSHIKVMIYCKLWLNVLIGLLLYTRIYGQLAINIPEAGNYGEETHMNCTEASFNITNGYTWYKDNLIIYDNINGDATGKYTSTHGIGFFTLTITNTVVNDGGEYACNYNFVEESGTLEIQAQGTTTAKLSSSNQLEFTFKQIYPNTASANITCDSENLNGSFVSSVADGDRFTCIWQSLETFSNLPSSCSASVKLISVMIIEEIAIAALVIAVIETYNCFWYNGLNTSAKCAAPAVILLVIIIIGIAIEAKFNIWERMSCLQKIASFFVLFGLGLFICYLIKKYQGRAVCQCVLLGLSSCLVIVICCCKEKAEKAEKVFWYAVKTYSRTGNWSDSVAIRKRLRVKNVTPRGPADGKLKVGYQIHEINRKAVTEEDQSKIEAMINDEAKLILRVSEVGILETSDVELTYKKGELLGFEVEHLAMVTDVTNGDGKMEKGDRILSINGKSTAGKSIGDINKLLKEPPQVLELSIKRGGRKRKVTLHFAGKASSGIAINKEGENIVVSTIQPESAAAKSEEVQNGDCILSTNGVSTAGLDVEEIEDMLTFSIILKVTKDVTLKELDPDKDGSFGLETSLPSTSTSVTFYKPTNTTIVTPDNPIIMVKSVTPNGPAALHGIKPGDKIVSINGNETKGKSHQEIKAMLETFGTSISLKIGEGIPCGTSGHEKDDTLTHKNETDHEVPDSRRTLPPIKNVDEKNHLLGNPLEPIPRKN